MSLVDLSPSHDKTCLCHIQTGANQPESQVQSDQHLCYFLCLDNYAPHRRGGGHIVFGADPVGLGVGFGVRVTLSCLHDIS